MNAEPQDWNVVVVGAWNTAILTPQGIQHRLFNLDPGTPIEVQVAINEPAPPRVRHQGMTVLAGPDRLVVTPDTPDFEHLTEAAEVASRAATGLPDTPFKAVGINIRYGYQELPGLVGDAMECSLDETLLNSDKKVMSRMTRRTLPFNQGTLNLEIIGDDPGGKIALNFHLQTSVLAEIEEWFSTIGEVENMRNYIFRDILQLETQAN